MTTLKASAAHRVESGLSPATSHAFGVEAFDAAGNVSSRATVGVTTNAVR